MKTPLSKLLLCLMLLASDCPGQQIHESTSVASDQGNVQTLTVAGASIRLALAPGEMTLSRAALVDWVKSDANAVSTYYGRFPVTQLELVLTPTPGDQISQGVTYGEGKPVIRVGIGQAADADALARDWILVHEMVHLALPLLPRRHHWLEEGIATYVEPIARAQAGSLNAEKVWGDLLHDLHQGLPQAGDEGLDNTHTWGRTYWGGALFCLLADVRLREQTTNRYGLQQALRAIDRESGGITVERSILNVLQTGDAATGTHVLTDLYREMANQPVTPDLDALWKKLGLALVDGDTVFDDNAPLANIRRAILAPPKP
jgi:hypothetical protein